LWASTGTKNKDYSDVLYVEELIGPNTVNTVPPATLDAFRDHGKPRDSLEENLEDARRVLEELEKSGISLDAITDELVKDGVKLFADAADKLYGAVAHKRATSLGGGIDRQQLALGDGIRQRPSRKAPKNGALRRRSAACGGRTNRSGPMTTKTNGWAG
jgi:transaldolase/glucose-6-phosphate isomerase